MAKPAKKVKKNTRALAQQKRHRRQWLTFVRMCRYGINNFTRNAWLTVAATAVMTITLLIIFATVIASNVLADSVAELSKKVDMSIYLRTGTTEQQAKPVIYALRQLSNVEDVTFISSEQARAQNAQNNKTDQDVLEAISQATNKLPAVIRINLKNINDTAQLDEFVKENKELKPIISPNRAPSFAGSRRNAIENIEKSGMDQLIVTDSVPLREAAKNCKKIRVLSIAGLVAESIRRIHVEESISSLFVN